MPEVAFGVREADELSEAMTRRWLSPGLGRPAQQAHHQFPLQAAFRISPPSRARTGTPVDENARRPRHPAGILSDDPPGRERRVVQDPFARPTAVRVEAIITALRANSRRGALRSRGPWISSMSPTCSTAWRERTMRTAAEWKIRGPEAADVSGAIWGWPRRLRPSRSQSVRNAGGRTPNATRVPVFWRRTPTRTR